MRKLTLFSSGRLSPDFVDLLRLLGLPVLCMGIASFVSGSSDVAVDVGAAVGLVIGYMLAGLGAPADGLWRRVFFASLTFTLFCNGLALAMTCFAIWGLDWRMPGFWSEAWHWLMSDVVLSTLAVWPLALVGGGVACLIRRWRHTRAR
jgi:hypothetical protein